MARARMNWQRLGVNGLFVLGVAWVAIHLFLILATLYAIFFPLMFSAVPFFFGTRALSRGSSRLATALTCAGATLMIASDLYVTAIFPRFPQSYPVATMMKLVGSVYGWKYSSVPTPASSFSPESR